MVHHILVAHVDHLGNAIDTLKVGDVANDLVALFLPTDDLTRDEINVLKLPLIDHRGIDGLVLPRTHCQLDWIYTKKADTKQDFILHFSKHKGGMVSMTHRPYDEDFKKSIVALYQNGKTQSQLSKEYGVSLSAIGKWIRLYSEVKTVDGDIMTAKQIKDVQRRNAQLEEENLILKKAIAIFTPHSNND